jgi:hypothetical protein
MSKDNFDKMTGSELQDSQSGGGSGRLSGTMDETQRSGQIGGGADAADMSNAGGSSGTGGYGSSQDVANRQDQQQGGTDGNTSAASGQSISRGERYDEEANGGRGADDVSPSSDELEFAEDQQSHQDRGQSDADEDFNREA